VNKKLKLKTDNFETTLQALEFIDDLARKNSKCHGKLSCTPTKDPEVYGWHVTYNPALIKEEG
jgi:hypothetical protein